MNADARVATMMRNVLIAALIGISCSQALCAPEAAPQAMGNQSNAPGTGATEQAAALQAAQKAADAAQKAAEAAQQAAAAAKQAADQAAASAGSAASAGKQSADAAGSAAVTAQSAGEVAKQAAANAQNSASDVEKAKSQAQASAGMAAAVTDMAKKSALKADAAAGVALNGSTNVKDNVTIQAVLLPYKQTRKVFSKEIADHYAVVQISINNQSKDAAFVLHSAFLDYSHWALSGGVSATADCAPSTVDSQVANCPSQVASVESRVIRGELQDAANWTWRNGLIRAAVLVGAIGAAMPAFHSMNAVKYVGVYNGDFIPGVQVLFPDSTIPQMNRVSDFGYQDNKIIAKSSADLVYAFFPVERFLTPGISKIFLKAPAIFFAPAQLFIDQHIARSWRPWPGLSQSNVNEVKNLIETLADDACQLSSDVPNKAICPGSTKGPARDEKMLGLLMMDCSCPVPADNGASGETKSQSCKPPSGCSAAKPIQKLVRSISLNSIQVMVQGTMTVDVTTVPGQIDEVTFGTGNDVPASWETTNKPIDVVIKGRFLTNATPEIPSIEAPAGKESDIKKYLNAKTITLVTDDSTDTRLHFQLKWTEAILPGSKLHIQVTKTDPKDTKKTPVKSMDFVLAVNYVASATGNAGTPSISGGIKFANEDKAATWKTGSTLEGTATGSALSNAKLEVTEIATSGGKAATVGDYFEAPITDMSKANDANNYFFTMKIKKDVPNGSKLTFQVSATGKDGKTNNGDKAQYQVKYP